MNTGALQLALLAKDRARRRAPRYVDSPQQLEIDAFIAKLSTGALRLRPRGRTAAMAAQAVSYATLCELLRSDRRILEGKSIRYNVMNEVPEIEGVELDEAFVGRLRERIENETTGKYGVADIQAAIVQLSAEQKYHPVAEYLRSLKWDGVERISFFAEEVLGIHAPTSLDLAISRRWFISAVARALLPGCKVDTVLILVGPQGKGKSTVFETLTSEAWFSDSGIDLASKDAFMTLRRVWVLEWPELETMMRARADGAVKAFISSRNDTYRPTHGRMVLKKPRHCIFVGTTNDDEFLADPTGNRRYWIIKVPGAIDLARAAEWRDQLWAEAITAYRAGEPWWLTKAEDEELRTFQTQFVERDAWEHAVLEFLRTTTRIVTTDMLLEECIQRPLLSCTSGDRRRLGRILKRAGYEPVSPRDAEGRQFRAWKLVTDVTDKVTDKAGSSVTENPPAPVQLKALI